VSPPALLIDGGPSAAVTLALAHGAGAPMDSPFMTAITDRLVERGHRVARFEFPYMAARRTTGTKRPPDRQPVLLATWRTVIDTLGGPRAVVVGGKSLGGRMASMVADGGARGLVCLGYPFHAPAQPDKPRIDHLRTLTLPALIVQGTRDPFGKPEEVAGYSLPPTIQITWITDGDHDLKPRKTTGRTHNQALDEAVNAVDAYLRNVMETALSAVENRLRVFDR